MQPKGQWQALPLLYEPCTICGGSHPTAAGSEISELYKDEILTLAQEIYKRKNGLNYSPELLKTTAGKIMQAVKEGYGNIKAQWNSPDKAMIDNLTQNVYSFSAAKNYQELRDITNAMIGENGNLNEWSDFRSKVQEINGKYNRDWLQTEYDTAVSSAQSAARWADFQGNADIMPMLQYQTVGDDKVRKEHRLLDGTRKPINHAFWKTYYPPNGWRCRCEAIQLPYSDTTEVEPQGYPPVPEMFKTNLAKTGLIFPKGHAYYEGVPKDILRRSLQYIPQENAWNIRKEYEEHAMVQYESEANENREIAKMLYENGERNIRLMPRLEEYEQEVRKTIYGEKYAQTHATKCPDSFIGTESFEFKKCVNGQRKVRIRKAALQANNAVIQIIETMDKENIDTFVAQRWVDSKCVNLKRIVIITGGNVYKYQRP
jgi:SPP1 gp7 family putative phage head morphogenesis protein